MVPEPTTPNDRIWVECPRCGRRSHTSHTNIGKSGRCKCGHSFVVAETHTRRCPNCGQDNLDSSNRCSLCNAIFDSEAAYHERSSQHVLAEYETHQDIEDFDHRVAHYRRWHRIGFWLLIASLPFALLAGGRWVWWYTSGGLPTVELVERDMRIWALQERPAILRGRPLRMVPFTNDASKSPIDQPLFSLYLDDRDHVVAFAADIFDFPNASENPLYQLANPLSSDDRDGNEDARYRMHTIERFAARYLRNAELDPTRIPGVLFTKDEDYEGVANQLRETSFWTHGRYDLELTIIAQMDSDDPKKRIPIMRHCVYIVKGREW